jgi:multicomponent Na+:H+ antiporter subunit F
LSSTFLQLAALLIAGSVLLCVVRLALGKTLVDRVAAIDMLTIVSISMIALYAHVADRFIYVDVALVYGVLSFLAVVAMARYLERGL